MYIANLTPCNDEIGYSDGSFRADDEDLASGGQCEGGLKMIIAIGEPEFLTSGNRSGGDNPRHDPGPSLPPTQLAGIAACAYSVARVCTYVHSFEISNSCMNLVGVHEMLG